jgi:hypothetical protein
MADIVRDVFMAFVREHALSRPRKHGVQGRRQGVAASLFPHPASCDDLIYVNAVESDRNIIDGAVKARKLG